jgi:hypothetical protein
LKVLSGGRIAPAAAWAEGADHDITGTGSGERAAEDQPGGGVPRRSGGERIVLGTLLGLFALRVVAAGLLDPGRDELAYWWWSTRGLDAGYSLVTTGGIRIATSVLGDTIWAIRLPGLLASGLASIAFGLAVRRLGGSRALGAAAALSLGGSLWQSYAGTIAHPDSWLTLWVALFGLSAADLVRAPSPHRAAAPALWAALAALTKLTGAVLFVPAAWLAWRAARREPRGAAAAAAILAGTGAWLARSWDVRTLAGLRELGRFDPGLGAMPRLALTGGEIVLLAGPALLLLAVAGASALRARDVRARWPAGAAAALLAAWFTAFLATGQAKGNWFLPVAVLIGPPGAIALARAGRSRWVGGTAVAGALAPLALGALMLAVPSRPPGGIDRTYGWHTGERERRVSPTTTWTGRLAEYRGGRPVDPRVVRAVEEGARVVASPDYGLAFEMVWELGGDLDVWIPDDPVFASTCGPPPAGADVVWVTRSGGLEPPGGSFREVPAREDRIETGLGVFRCRSFAGESPAGRESETMLSGAGLALLLGAATAVAAEPVRPDHAPFDALLREYVTHYGVRYAAWHGNEADREALQSYLEHLQSVPISAIEAREDGHDEALAYWINLYNAATLDLVLEGYPVDSIKDLGNLIRTPWKRDVVVVEGQRLSLDEIENGIIRERFAEPRIHFALNCAAIGCPPLRAGAYTGEHLSTQLEEQTMAFLGDPGRNWVDEEGTVHLSRILDWYRDDFVAAAGSVTDFVRPYMPMLQELKPGSEPPIRHVDYDWALNESPEGR